MEANLRWPSVFRKRHKEQDLVTFFVQRAGMYTNDSLPRSPAQWLSLMQHVGLPTRLLDWSDSALVGLFFAVHSEASIDAAVWMLDPIELNKLSNIVNLPASFTEPVVQSYNAAFSENLKMYHSSQSRYSPLMYIEDWPYREFTIHGSDQRSFVAQFEQHAFCDDGRLVKLRVPVLVTHSKRNLPSWESNTGRYFPI